MEHLFTRFATQTAKLAGKPWTFIACVALVLVWAASGPVFKFSETWQLVINTGTTIITFLMVFLIQNTQNRDGAAMQAKLDEIVYGVAKADNRFVGIEHLTDKELDAILDEVEKRATAIHAEKRARAGGKPRDRAIAARQPTKARPGRSGKAPAKKAAK